MPTHLFAAILRVMRGESVVADEMTSKLVAAYRGRRQVAARRRSDSDVTIPPGFFAAGTAFARELEILRAIARGREQQGDRTPARYRRTDREDPCAAHQLRKLRCYRDGVHACRPPLSRPAICRT